MSRKLPVMFSSLLLASAAMIQPHAVHAAEDPLLELIRILKENNTINQEAYTTLRTSIESRLASSPAADQPKKVKARVNSSKKLQVASEDGDFKFEVGGRIYVDAAAYDDDKSDMGNGTELRAARLYMAGKLWQDWSFKGQYDFADNKTSIKDAWIAYNGFNNTSIKFGNQKEPFSLENMTSTRYTTFMERGLPNAFINSPSDRTIGASVFTNGNNWSLHGGVFGSTAADTTAATPDSGWALVGRANWAPVHEQGRVLHVGASAGVRYLDSRDENVTWNSNSGTHLTKVTLSSASIANADDLNRFGLETAAVMGPFAMQAEYMYASVNTSNGIDPSFDGYYIEGSYYLTGETRNYNPKKGNFGRLTPKGIVGKGGIGAWQIALRYDAIDLTDDGIIGGEQEDITIGLNWQTTPNIRFMANYVKVLEVDRPGNARDGDEPSVFQLRGMVDF